MNKRSSLYWQSISQLHRAGWLKNKLVGMRQIDLTVSCLNKANTVTHLKSQKINMQILKIMQNLHTKRQNRSFKRGAGDDQSNRDTKSYTRRADKYEPCAPNTGRTVCQACSLRERAQGNTRESLPSMGAGDDRLAASLGTNT